MKKLKQIFLLLILASASFVGCRPQDTAPTNVLRARSAYSPYGTAEETPLRWADSHLSNGLSLKASDQILTDLNVGSGQMGHNLMAQNWNNAIVGKTFFILPLPTVSNRQKPQLINYFDDEMGIYKSTSWYNEVGAQALAITQFFGIRKQSSQGEYIELQHADIILNYKDYSFSSDPDDFLNYDLPSVLLHEMGHFIGLRHEYSTYESIMRPSLGSYESERSLYAKDIEKLKQNYLIGGNSHLEANSSGIHLGAINNDENEFVRGHFELKANGECHHYINGKYTQKHLAKLFRLPLF